MNNLLSLPGKPSRERYDNPEIPKPHEANWQLWLAAEMAKRGIDMFRLAIPNACNPDYNLGKAAIERHKVNNKTGFVTHSAGSELGLRYLSENPQITIERLVLVAPWRDMTGKYGDFSNYTLDPNLLERVGRMSIFNSLDDSPHIHKRVAELRDTFPEANYIEFNDYGHFMLGNNMTSEEFPKLLADLTEERL